MAGCVPLKGCFKGEPVVKRVNERGAVKVFNWGVWARKKESVKVADMECFEPDAWIQMRYRMTRDSQRYLTTFFVA